MTPTHWEDSRSQSLASGESTRKGSRALRTTWITGRVPNKKKTKTSFGGLFASFFFTLRKRTVPVMQSCAKGLIHHFARLRRKHVRPIHGLCVGNGDELKPCWMKAPWCHGQRSNNQSHLSQNCSTRIESVAMGQKPVHLPPKWYHWF